MVIHNLASDGTEASKKTDDGNISYAIEFGLLTEKKSQHKIQYDTVSHEDWRE